MKTTILTLLLPLLLLSCTGDRQEPSRQGDFKHNSIPLLLKHFKEPPMRYAPIPFFVWNGKVTKEELAIQLDDMKKKGFGGVFVHPRPGMITEYLSDDWFDLFDFTLQRCRKLGMDVWIYDENSYPSGFAGGHVPDRMPESYSEGVGLNGLFVDRLPSDLSPYTVVLRQAGDHWEDITGQPDQTTGQDNNYCLFEKTYYPERPWNAGFSFVDVLKPGVTETFLDITMRQGYEKYFNSDFGGVIQGVFSDEPCIYAPDWTSIRWTPGLFDAFRQKWGYDLQPHLPSLIAETGNWKEVCYHYYYILLQLFVENWSIPMMNYFDENQLKWTGHYWEHEWPDPDNCPDNMAMYAYHQVPGIDLLYNYYDEEVFFPATPNNWPQPQFGCVRNVKEMSSVSNQLGKERSFCELWGGCGWDLTFNDMKRLGDWAFTHGVNFLCQHLCYMTIQGARKYDYPPSYSYHEPWWEHYRIINDYYRRLSFALTSGRQINKTLIIEPTTTAWMYTRKGSTNEKMVDIGKSFQDFITALEKLQIEYDLASEHILEVFGSITDGRLQVGERIYDCIVIPSMAENVNAATVKLLQSCQATEVYNLASTLRVDGKQTQSNGFTSINTDVKTLPSYLWTDDWQVISHDTKQGNLYHQRRVLDDGQLLFFSNVDEKEKAGGTFRVKGRKVWRLDPQTGDYSEYPADAKNGYVFLTVDIQPSESLLLAVSSSGRPQKGAKKDASDQGVPVVQRLQPASGIAVTQTEDNVLTLDFCDLLIEGKKYADIHTLKASDLVFQQYGFHGNPWNSAVQFRDEWLKHQFPEKSGYEAVYRFEIESDIDPSVMKLVVESGATTVHVNGCRALPAEELWWLDRSFRVYPVGGFVRQGTNEITLSVSPMHILAEIEPVYLLGNFRLESAKRGWKMTTPESLHIGSWRNQGLPFYARTVDYTAYYQLDAKESYRVRLPEWNGTVAEVLINDRSAGVIYTPPYVLDITGRIETGKNRITVRVFGSNKNLIGPFHGRIPKGLASPGQWKGARDGMPEGVAYQQLDYGLFDDFIIDYR